MSKESLQLPKTAFSMKANLPKKEPDIIHHWEKINLYKFTYEHLINLLKSYDNAFTNLLFITSSTSLQRSTIYQINLISFQTIVHVRQLKFYLEVPHWSSLESWALTLKWKKKLMVATITNLITDSMQFGGITNTCLLEARYFLEI